MPKSPAFWEPYCHRSEAEFHLSNFATRVLGRHSGVVYFDGMNAARLKSATPDANGHALDLVVTVSRPPLMPPDPLSTADAQTLDQLARGWSERLAAARASAGQPSAFGRGVAQARQFIEGHKMGFDTAAVVGDTFGVLAGVVSVVAIIGGGVALAPVLGLAAGAVSLFLLAEDGAMLRYELTGDEVRKKRLETSWHYRMIETIGPILLLPDLAVSGVHTLASLPKVAREAGEAAEEAVQAGRRLANQNQAMDVFKRASSAQTDRTALQTQARQLEAQRASLANGVREAQRKLMAARRELLLLRTIEAPAYVATLYGSGVYGIDPPEPTARGLDWLAHQAAGQTSEDPHHPAQLLVPEQPRPVEPGCTPPAMQFHVAVSHHPGSAP